ncbi:enolase C-terminal domain-like protein [Desulfobaculum sp. SPO524]|uniref:enolase C-terminal domain-like protein n=1 Tax=Desulfobaculum sp. SPO524 TaxID=3378071 RepID=UPI0038552582
MTAVVDFACGGVVRRPLVGPYQLSFATLEEFAVVWGFVQMADGSCGVGEAVPLPGYGAHGVDEVAAGAQALCRAVVGLSFDRALARATMDARENPFAASAMGAALELPKWLEHAQGGFGVPLVHPVDADGEEGLLCVMEDACAAGATEFKMKIGRDVESDIVAALLVLERARDCGAQVRFDANQGYSPEAAREFCHALETAGVGPELRWVEQPLHRDDWDGMAALCASTRLPLLLDEPIYRAEHVDRAARVGACGVKLKLCKHPGLSACADLARHARALGLCVTLGNGVGTDISNLGEALVRTAAPQAFTGALECSGFARVSAPLLGGVVRRENGALVVDGAPTVDAATCVALRSASERSW